MPASASAPATSTAPSEEDLLAAGSLRQSALTLMNSSSLEQGRNERLKALTGLAERLQPGNIHNARLLGSIQEDQRNLEAAAELAGLCFNANPDDHALGVRYLQLGSAALKRPDEKKAFLESTLSKQQTPAALRAEAAMMLGEMLMKSGQKEQAMGFFSQALQLDPYCAQAAQAQVSVAGNPQPADSAKALVASFRANPRSIQVIYNLGFTLNYLGLHKQALAFLDIGWELGKQSNDKLTADRVTQYLAINLDAEDYSKAIGVYDSLPSNLSGDRQVIPPIVEAYRRSGQTAQADQLAQRMLAGYGQGDPNSLSPRIAMDVASFMIGTDTTPRAVLGYARRAAGMNPDTPEIQRLLGAAEVMSGQAELLSSGMDRLEKLKTADAFAAILLAEARYAAGQDDAGREALLAVAGALRNGLTYRRLAALAKQKKVDLPPVPGAEEIRQTVEQLSPDTFRMATHPQEFVAIRLKTAKNFFAPGEPIEIDSQITNISKVDLPLGDWGLFHPVMNLQVAASPGPKEQFTVIPAVEWPAPRTLPAGASVSQSVRLDSGLLADFLARRPLEDVTLTITGLVDPVQKGMFKQESSIPPINPQPLVITRSRLMQAPQGDTPEAWSQAYQYALRVIVTDLSRGDLSRRMQAARQAASLIVGVREIERGRAKLPDQLHGAVNKPVILAMLKKALADRSCAVRAEALAAMGPAKMDDSILAVIVPMEKDPSPLVRLRLAELLGVSRATGQQAVVERLAKDSDEMVQTMAGAFQRSQPAK